MLETRIAKELAYISQAGLARRITGAVFCKSSSGTGSNR